MKNTCYDCTDPEDHLQNLRKVLRIMLLGAGRAPHSMELQYCTMQWIWMYDCLLGTCSPTSNAELAASRIMMMR